MILRGLQRLQQVSSTHRMQDTCLTILEMNRRIRCTDERVEVLPRTDLIGGVCVGACYVRSSP